MSTSFHLPRCSRFLATAFFASNLFCGGALGFGHVTQKTAEAAADESIVIPDWKLDLVAGNGHDWWTKFGLQGMIDGIRTAIWGDGLPAITASPAQDAQRCPIIKLPESFVISAKTQTWYSLSGEWSTANGVTLAAWGQSYIGLGFSRDIKHISVYYRAASTGLQAVRTRYFTDTEMFRLFGWRPRQIPNATSAGKGKDKTFNIGIFDCTGTLMYVVKKTSDFPRYVHLYSRDGTIVAQTMVGSPVLRYQFADPKTGYLIAAAEAPGINASVKEEDIPRDVAVDGVLPFGFYFPPGGYKDSSALMDPDYRWVITAAVQALAIYEDKSLEMPWGIITAVEAFLIGCIVASILAVVGLLFCTYRMVYPYGEYHQYGKIAENPWLAVPSQPPLKAEWGNNSGNNMNYATMNNLKS